MCVGALERIVHIDSFGFAHTRIAFYCHSAEIGVRKARQNGCGRVYSAASIRDKYKGKRIHLHIRI